MCPNDGYNGAVAAEMSRINADNARDHQQDNPIRSSIEQDNNQSDQSDAFYCCSSDMCVLVQRLGLVKQIKRFSWHRRTNLNGLNVTLSASTCTNLSAYLVSSRVQRGIRQVLLKAESLLPMHQSPGVSDYWSLSEQVPIDAIQIVSRV